MQANSIRRQNNLKKSRMGFSEIEKVMLKNTILPANEINSERDEILDGEVLTFLQSQDHFRRVSDYIILPYKFLHKKFKTENIIVTKFVSNTFSVHDYVENILETLTMPFEIKIDFAFTIKNPTKTGHDRYRFVFPQRSTCLPTTSKLFVESDVTELIDYLRPKTQSDFLRIAYETHRNQHCFDKSGYVLDTLLTCVLFLSKVSNLAAPLPI